MVKVTIRKTTGVQYEYVEVTHEIDDDVNVAEFAKKEYDNMVWAFGAGTSDKTSHGGDNRSEGHKSDGPETLSGTITEIERRTTKGKDSRSYAYFRIDVGSKYPKTATAFGEVGKTILQHFDKGDAITVSGNTKQLDKGSVFEVHGFEDRGDDAPEDDIPF